MDRDRDYRDYQGGHSYDGFHRRNIGRRPITDYGTSMVMWMRSRRPRYKGGNTVEAERPSPSYIVDMLPPAARPRNAADSIPVKQLHGSQNRVKHPINVVLWTPDGRRCLTCSSDGEFTLWNGMAFNFETILRAHDSAIRAAVYSHSEEWLISADHNGIVKFWQPNFNNVRHIQAHDHPIRDLAFSPNDERYVTACDDSTLKIYNFAADRAESVLSGHNWDAKSVDWHRTKGLIVSGSKDHQVKLWDPRTGRCLTTLHSHKNTIAKTSFDPHKGYLLATCARDQTARIFDIRMMRDVCLLRGFEPRAGQPQDSDRDKDKDVSASTLTWHPVHSSMLSTGNSNGSIYHYLLDEPNTPAGVASSISPYDSPNPSNAPTQTIFPAHKVQYAHTYGIWSLSWHPLGHILASGSNDRMTRFWTRARPGEKDCFNDLYHIGAREAEAQGIYDRRGGRQERMEAEEREMADEADGLVDQTMPAKQPALPGLPGLVGAGPTASSNGVEDNWTGQFASTGPGVYAGMNQERYSASMAEENIVVPPPHLAQGIPQPPPNFDLSKLPPEVRAKLPFPGNLPPGFPPPPPPPNLFAAGGLPGMGPSDAVGGGAGSIRKRAPLPSQQESLMEEQRRGNFRVAR